MPFNGKSDREVFERRITLILERQDRPRPRDADELAEMQAALDVPDIPRATEHVWVWYLDLHSERQSSGFAPQPLSSTQIIDWCTLTRRRLQPWEARAIKRLDVVWRSIWAEFREAEEQERQQKAQAQRATSG